jgi:cytochrome c-type biogenesis protein CcmE
VSKGVQIAVGATVCALLLGWYGMSALDGQASYRYFNTLEEFLVEGPESRVGESLRIKGYVRNGSIDRRVADRQVRFAIQNEPPHQSGNSDDTLAIHFASLETPDLFQDGAEVVVEGEIVREEGEAVFLAQNVLAKCPSKFEAEAKKASAEDGADAANKASL